MLSSALGGEKLRSPAGCHAQGPSDIAHRPTILGQLLRGDEDADSQVALPLSKGCPLSAHHRGRLKRGVDAVELKIDVKPLILRPVEIVV